MKIESMKNNTLISSTRRQAIQRFLGVGYVLASSPVMSQSAIKTSAVGLSTQEVMIQRDGFKFPVYVARPEGQGNLPVMLVVSEVFGVHEYIADVARRFAHAGYCAMAPELFARQGDPGEYAQLSKLLAEVVDKVPDEQVMADLDACVQWAQEQGFNVSRLGINGFCWGGRIAWLYAAHQKKLKAAVAWYGRTMGAHSSLTPAHPFERLANLSAPVLGLYGAQDTSIPLSVINDFQAKLALVGQSGVQSALQSRLVIYPDVGHAFHADYRATYNPVAAQDGWSKTLDWFKKWL